MKGISESLAGSAAYFVIEWGKKLVALEVKFSTEAKYSDTDNLRLFMDEYPETVLCLIVYNGSEIKYLHDKIVAVPWYLLGGY